MVFVCSRPEQDDDNDLDIGGTYRYQMRTPPAVGEGLALEAPSFAPARRTPSTMAGPPTLGMGQRIPSMQMYYPASTRPMVRRPPSPRPSAKSEVGALVRLS